MRNFTQITIIDNDKTKTFFSSLSKKAVDNQLCKLNNSKIEYLHVGVSLENNNITTLYGNDLRNNEVITKLLTVI